MKKWDEVERLEPHYGVDSTMRTIVWMAKGSPGEYVRHDYANEIITELEQQKRELVDALRDLTNIQSGWSCSQDWKRRCLDAANAALKRAEGES